MHAVAPPRAVQGAAGWVRGQRTAMSSYLLFLADWTLCYVLLGLALNVLAGYAGINSLAIAATFGAGAYAFALLLAAVPGAALGPLVALIGAVGAGVVLNLLIAVPTLRISGAHFIVASLALQQMTYDFFRNSDLTGGTNGLSGISLKLPPAAQQAIMIVAALACIVAVVKLLRGRFGRLLTAVRNDEDLTASMGISVVWGKTRAAAVSGAIAGFAGAVYALNQSYIDPESFALHTSILAYAIVLIGGAGTPLGPVVGALVVLLVPELLSHLAVSPEHVGPLRRLIFGAILLLLLFVRPQGLVGRSAGPSPGSARGATLPAGGAPP